MNFLLFCVAILIPSSNAKIPDIPDVTNGLNRIGANVCSFTEQISKDVKVSYKQETLVTKWKETCCWRVIRCWKWCNESRLAKKSYTQYQTITKYFSRENYHCCSGWQRINDNANSCEKPVCDIECRNGGECVAPDTCKCKDGFEGKFCQLDINECDDPSRNNCEQTCLNKDGSFECACQRGYVLNNDKQTCSDINECNLTNDTLQDMPPPCGCRNSAHPCKATCVNTPGSYKCKCGKGFRLNGAEQCEDINECLENKDLCEQGCVNTPGSYYCQCHEGYKHDGVLCKDINECATNNGGCSDTCHNLNGTHVCSCPDRFYLDKDRRTCKVINGTLFKRQLVCESDLVGYLQCDNPDEKLAIIDVMYGRLSKGVCQSGDYQSNVRCVSTKGLKHLQQCFDKNVCIFYFDDNLDDPCPGVEKYMDIVYDCLK